MQYDLMNRQEMRCLSWVGCGSRWKSYEGYDEEVGQSGTVTERGRR
jgi:hypothetical protein